MKRPDTSDSRYTVQTRSSFFEARANQRLHKHEADQSVHTETNCEDTNTSRIGLNKCNSLKNWNSQDLQKAQEKADNMIKEVLSLLTETSRKSFKKLGSPGALNGLKQQLEELVSWVHYLNTSGGTEQDLEEVNRKIGIFERILSGNYTQSDIIRRFYYAKRTKLFQYKQYSKSTNKIINTDLNTAIYNFRTHQEKHKLLHVQLNSTYSQDFKQKKAARQSSCQAKLKYRPNNQKMPRSSYAVDFSGIAGPPAFSYCPSEIRTVPVGGSTKWQSTYNKNFYQSQQAPSLKFDSSDLNCRRDKFKQTRIPDAVIKTLNSKFSKNVDPKTKKNHPSGKKLNQSQNQINLSGKRIIAENNNQLSCSKNKSTINKSNKRLSEVKYYPFGPHCLSTFSKTSNSFYKAKNSSDLSKSQFCQKMTESMRAFAWPKQTGIERRQRKDLNLKKLQETYRQISRRI